MPMVLKPSYSYRMGSFLNLSKFRASTSDFYKVGKEHPAGDRRGPADVPSILDQFHCPTIGDVEKDSRDIVNNMKFKIFIGIVIMVNAVTIGMEVDMSKGDDINDRLGFFFCEICFTLIFFGEMLLKFKHLGWDYYLDKWNVLDYHLVVFSFIDLFLSIVFNGKADMKMMSAFRIVRMARLVRNVRLLHMFRELWMLVKGFIDTLATLFWVGVMLFMIVYVAAILLTILVGHSDWYDEQLTHNPTYYGTLIRSMWTVFQVITLESWADRIVRPLGRVSIGWYFFFLFILVLSTLGVLNVIIGVIVERTLSAAVENEKDVKEVVEKCELQIMEELGEHFVSEDGRLDFISFKRCIRKQDFLDTLKYLEVPLAEVEEIFSIMDVDRTGSISADDFVAAIQKIKGQASGRAMLQLIAYVQRANRRAQLLYLRYDKLVCRIDNIFEKLDDLWGMTEREIEERESHLQNLVKLKEKVNEKRKIMDRIDKNRMSWYRKYTSKTPP